MFFLLCSGAILPLESGLQGDSGGIFRIQIGPTVGDFANKLEFDSGKCTIGKPIIEFIYKCATCFEIARTRAAILMFSYFDSCL